ncbi:hypothetical protein [Micromonospora rubida]|uniref:hypothetical protein n=1 Tax=Micromonospora rubida TaxID=2697657 RepID=UPI00191C6C61|nr:hypothetical protein [Micromonospora rubida]
MTGVELIAAALAAGAGAGTSAAVVDVYTGLRDALRRRLTGRRAAEQLLEADEADPGVWERRIGAELADSGADRDEEILTAAGRLLDLVDPEGSRAGRYPVDLRGARGAQIGDGTLRVDTTYGPTAGIMTGPVSVSYGQLPVPPARPEA